MLFEEVLMSFSAPVFTHRQFCHGSGAEGLSALSQFAHNFGREKFDQK
jgi:hypothetical protein